MNITDIIIGIIVVVILLVAIKSCFKHMKGEGDCCGGGHSQIIPDKRIDNVIGSKKIYIDGMTCEKCVNRVKKALNSIDGASASVSLYNQSAILSFNQDISNELIIHTIDKAGYTVIRIE